MAHLWAAFSSPSHGCNCLCASSLEDMGDPGLPSAVKDLRGDAAIRPRRSRHHNRLASSNASRHCQHESGRRQHCGTARHVQADSFCIEFEAGLRLLPGLKASARPLPSAVRLKCTLCCDNRTEALEFADWWHIALPIGKNFPSNDIQPTIQAFRLHAGKRHTVALACL